MHLIPRQQQQLMLLIKTHGPSTIPELARQANLVAEVVGLNLSWLCGRGLVDLYQTTDRRYDLSHTGRTLAEELSVRYLDGRIIVTAPCVEEPFWKAEIADRPLLYVLANSRETAIGQLVIAYGASLVTVTGS